LLASRRVVLLSGGGSGKTFEIRHQARSLREAGKPAFFLRIENVLTNFSLAFDPAAGSHEEFLRWVESGEEGWIFLDSIDEARLHSSKDFERAIRSVGGVLAPTLPSAHVLITGREAAWRAVTDRELVRACLPYEPTGSTVGSAPDAEQEAQGRSAEPSDVPPDHEDGHFVEAELDAEVASETSTRPSIEKTQDVEPNAILVVGFDDLAEPQIAAFAEARGVTDVGAFIRAVERKQAHAETARPFDLEGLIDYWMVHRKVGSPSERTDATINARLDERDLDRAEAITLTSAEMRQAARQLAVANALMQTPEIRLHDAPSQLRGVDPKSLLSLTPGPIRKLLERPLFVASQLGAVRLYVQRVREFLTAEWLHKRLGDNGSRRKIAALFFRTQYGVDVVVPSMRGVLPWLALLDPGTLAQVRRIAPEVMFEGGDPSKLPVDLRCALLAEACERLAATPGRSSLDDLQAVQRFADPALADHIRGLMARYTTDTDVLYFLMRMVWQGEIRALLPEAIDLASASNRYNVRMMAIRTVADIGQEADRKVVRNALLSAPQAPDREWIAEAIETLPKDAAGIAWLIAACKAVKPLKRFSIDRLPKAVEDYITALPLTLLPNLIQSLQPLVAPKRSGAAADSGDPKQGRFNWLIGATIAGLERLVVARDRSVFRKAVVRLLLRLPSMVSLGDSGGREGNEQLTRHVGEWSDLSRELFWADVAATRARRFEKNGEPVRSIVGLGFFGHYWKLTADDGDYLEEQIRLRPLLDDRLVALSAAVVVLRNSEGTGSWRRRLRKRVQGVAELEAMLDQMLAPASAEVRKWRRQAARLKQRSKRQEAKRESNRQQWRAHLPGHLESLRKPYPGGGVRQNQFYLYERLREASKKSSRWTDGNWQFLIPEFGTSVATAFRDGAINFWRTNTPKLLSTGGERNSTPATTLYGLAGLSFESQSSPTWAAGLTEDEAELAARYALRELNGFPTWLPRLFNIHPAPVLKIVLGEIDFELETDSAGQHARSYVLNDVSSVGQWIWPSIAPEIIRRLGSATMVPAHLRPLLGVVAGSNVPDQAIATLASVKATAASDEVAAVWFAAWIGVDPDDALPAFERHLSELADKPRQVNVAMHALMALTGGRDDRRVARDRWRTVSHLTTLFLLMHRYIAEEDDIERAGRGVYSPRLRDDAQQARDALLSPLRDTPGEEAYDALRRIASKHPSQRGREWAAKLALERATADANRPGWSNEQVLEFQEALERTPKDHRELHELAVERLLDYKQFLEHGEMSVAPLLLDHDETVVRNAVAQWCDSRRSGRYSIHQEEERANSQRTDIRFQGINVSGPVPVELKLADRWSGAELAERLENQLCNDYLRDEVSSRGVFLLIQQKRRAHWDMPDGTRATSLEQLVEALQRHWNSKKHEFLQVHEVQVIGIDLTAHARPLGRSQSTPANKTRSTLPRKVPEIRSARKSAPVSAARSRRAAETTTAESSPPKPSGRTASGKVITTQGGTRTSSNKPKAQPTARKDRAGGTKKSVNSTAKSPVKPGSIKAQPRKPSKALKVAETKGEVKAAPRQGKRAVAPKMTTAKVGAHREPRVAGAQRTTRPRGRKR